MNAIFEKVKKNPSIYYSMMIAATWAGAGSLIVGMTMAQKFGIIPYIIWAIGNTLACIVFGLLAMKVPKLVEVAMSKPVKIIVGFMCCFQIWVNMQGIFEALSGTMVGVTAAKVVVYVCSLFFIFYYLTMPMLKNVTFDHMTWIVVYGLIISLMIVSYSINGASSLSLGLEHAGIMNATKKAIMLIPGCFLYPVFWEMIIYNEKNEDGTAKTDIRSCFIAGGLLFGLYLVFVFLLAFTSFSPVMNLIKGILISFVAISSVASFIYSVFITFGKKFGTVVNLFAVGGWAYMIPLGVLGLWTRMAEIRIVIVFIEFLVAAGIYYAEKRKVKVDVEEGQVL